MPVSSLIFAIYDVFHTYCYPLGAKKCVRECILDAQGAAIGVKTSQIVKHLKQIAKTAVSIHVSGGQGYTIVYSCTR